MNMQRQACSTLLHTFQTLASFRNVPFTTECAVYLSKRSKNFYISAKKKLHFFEEVAQHPPHVMMWAGVTSELITGAYFICL
jgi:hypothetical protein